ncbi:hypothetical protein [uncultured Abyssibacter sp.]|uniref:hypothetical protein n=1 Tax=uncultured Abyssibacter sp. TaxID=2320202 RepID=UPI0032B25F3E|tara:strand:+ start:154 stop:522 length:369 start_codon:yes stop_codon:yes gene_type:complete
MKSFVTTIIIAAISMGCATHKITLDEKALKLKDAKEIQISMAGTPFPHCGAQYLTVLTIGLFPSICDREYEVRSEKADTEGGLATVTYVQGWVSLILAPSSNWSFDDFELEKQIESKVRSIE